MATACRARCNYPAAYEKGKQYPLIVQIYEIESNQLHNWMAPVGARHV